MPHPETPLERLAVDCVLADPICSALLERLPGLGLPDWWLTAGAVFRNIWNHVEGKPAGHGIKDYDVFYFDDADLSWEAEDSAIRRVDELASDLPGRVEVRDEARVHLWYADKFGVPAMPFTSATDAIDAFASTTCCAGVTSASGTIQLYAPHGLADIFAVRMRPNRRLVPERVYQAKVSQYREHWPSLTADPW